MTSYHSTREVVESNDCAPTLRYILTKKERMSLTKLYVHLSHFTTFHHISQYLTIFCIFRHISPYFTIFHHISLYFTTFHHISPGSSEAVPCEGGMYQKLAGQDTCEECPEGYFCPPNTSDFESNPCPEGAYCPVS